MRQKTKVEAFKDELRSKYGDDIDEALEAAVEDVWTVALVESEAVRRAGKHSDAPPSFRKFQKEAAMDILHNLYIEDKDVVTLSAPTGAGKSLILHAVMLVVEEVLKDTNFGENSFFTTPLNTLIDQVNNDEFMAEDIVSIKGKNNYDCVHPSDKGTQVGSAICQRQDNFDCDYKNLHHENGGCPYYGRRMAAQDHPEVVTNMSFLMANSMIPDIIDSKLESRELLVADECQNIENYGLGFIGFIVSSGAVPSVFDDIREPDSRELREDEDAAEWLHRDVLTPVKEEIKDLERKPRLTEPEVEEKEKLKQFAEKVSNFLRDFQEHHWVSEKETYGKNNQKWKIKFNPIYIGRFLDDFLWDQGNKVVLSSATIPQGAFLNHIGLHDKDTATVKVPSTFPVERRPVFTDEAVGKMTQKKRHQTIPKMADKIAKMADHFEGHRGFIHCHSYNIAERLYKALPREIRNRATLQDNEEREASLQKWLNGDKNDDQIFLSVAMDEGVSLEGDKTRWQVVAKAAYPYLGDERINYKVTELGEWTWYASQAAISLMQAVGRGMRSKDDWCYTYILDTSAVDLIENNEGLFEDWFLNAVDVEPNIDQG